MMNVKELRASFSKKVAESGLTAKDAELSKFTPLIAEEVRSKLKGLTLHPAAGFTLPYFDVNGKRTDFYRFRYLEQPPRNGFAALTVQKPWRYIQPAAVQPQVYFPKAIDWKSFFELPAADYWLLITEGEMKTACAAKHGLPCLGLGGVWTFKSKRNLLLPQLAELPFAERSVYTVYDSDACTNPDVLAALNAFAKELLLLGAKVFPMILPALGKNKKTGLDDFIVAKGADKFEELRRNAEPWEASRALHEMNEHVVMLHDSGDTVLELSTMQRYSTNTFKTSLYANRFWDVEIHAQGKSVKIQRKPAATEWVRWPYRAEVARAVYEPGREKFIADGLNTWRGWGLEPKKGDVTLWHDYMDFYFENAPAANRKWFTQWLAWPLIHPGDKMFSAVVAYSHTKGAGKSLLGHTMARIYGTNFSEIDEATLTGNFNEWAENKQWIMGEEISGGNKRKHSELIKNYITSVSLRLNPKYVRAYETRNCINFYFCSNHPDSFFIEDGERRYFVHELRCGRLVDRDPQFVKAYDKWYRSDAGAAALFDYLLHVDLTGFDPKAPAPETEARLDMIDAGRSELEAWVARLREDPDSVLVIAGGVVVPRSLMTLDEIFACFDPLRNKRLTPQGLGRALSATGFQMVGQLTIPLPEKLLRPKVWAVRNRERLEGMSLPQLAEIYCEEWGIQRPARAPYGSKKGGN
jgi:hypothetical protein